MLLSLFTPTHTGAYLNEVYSSLNKQGDVPFEWVIVLNGDEVISLPDQIVRDPRVSVFTYESESDVVRVGELKKFACSLCKGDVLVELDHDDLLMPGILKDVADRFQHGADFVFSDTASFIDQYLTPMRYNPAHGWEHYPFRLYGKLLTAVRCFPVTARSLCELHYSPDHIRAWSREIYEEVGGHDELMQVADDHDLICRTYLAGARFSHIKKCGYLYRLHPDNTVNHYNEAIQQQQAINKQIYLRGLVAQWCCNEGLDYGDVGEWLGNGWKPAQDKFPVEPNSVGYIQNCNFLQYFTPDECVKFFNQAYEALVPGGFLLLDLPDADDPRNLQSNQKAASWHNAGAFDWYTQSTYSVLDSRINCRYQMVNMTEYEPKHLPESMRGTHLRVEMCALKGQRQPGLVHI